MHIYTMNTKTRQNPTKAITNEYVVDDYYEGMLVFERSPQGSATYFGVPASRAEAGTYEGQIVDVTIDTGLGHRNGGQARLVGWVGKDGVTAGNVPTRSVPVYVFK